MDKNDIKEWLKELETEIRDAMDQCNTSVYHMWMSNSIHDDTQKSNMVYEGYTRYQPESMKLEKAINRYMFIAEHM